LEFVVNSSLQALFALLVVSVALLLGGYLLSESVPSDNLMPDSHSTTSVTKPSVPSWQTSSTEYAEEDYLNLKGTVRYDGVQFIITNTNDFHWVNVELDLNGGLWSSGYVYRIPRIPVGTWYIDVTNFTKKNGEIFNPFSMRPLRLAITAYNDAGEVTGFGMHSWE